MSSDAAHPSQPNRASYAIRHWRGDLSLPVSYWINNVLLTTALVFVLLLIGAAFETADNPLIRHGPCQLRGKSRVSSNRFRSS